MALTLLNDFLLQLVAKDASDLHLKAGHVPRIRVNGELEDIPGAPVLGDEDTESIATEVIRPHLRDRFARGHAVDFAYVLDDVGRFRANAYRQRDTVALVFRRVVTDIPTREELHLPEQVHTFADLPRGLVLVCGPTGSGKTTTLASMVDRINSTRKVHVITIEDPIEVIHEDKLASISQRELGADTPDYLDAMRSALRQDPDVILVGEMRDADTVKTAMMAAETGHLVLSTLHTTDAAETVNRIVEFFPPHEQRQVRLVLAGVLRGTICQRLLPTASGEDRVPATETMVSNGRIQTWIMQPDAKLDVNEIIADGEYYGMHTFDQSILQLFEDGKIDLRAAMANASNPHDLRVKMQRRGVWPDGGLEATVGRDDDDQLATLVAELDDDQPKRKRTKRA